MRRTNFLILITGSMLTSCFNSQHPVNLVPPVDNNKKINAGKLITVALQSLSSTVRLPGQLKPFEAVSIYPKINGFVKHIYADRGSIVRKGQILARLEAPEIGAQIKMAASKYEHAKAIAAASREHYLRLKEAASEPGAVAQFDLDNALARMKADEAVMQSENANVSSMTSINDYLVIVAPFDGIIIQRNVSEGALVGGGKGTDQPIFVLEETQKLRLEVMIPEAYTDKITVGQEVSFFLNTNPNQIFKGSVSRMANSVGSLRSEIIEIDVPNQQHDLKPGMYAEVNIPLRSSLQSIVVPSSAVVRSTERMYVITVQGNKAHLVNVKEGMSNSDSVILFGDMAPGTAILLHATDDVKEGDSLNVN